MKRRHNATVGQVWRAMSLRFKIGLIITLCFLILGFIFPLFNQTDPMALSAFKKNLRPSLEHFFGTNKQGQDIFWLLVESIKNSIILGMTVALFATVIGVLVGLTAGFVGGALDRILMFICDSIIVVPSLPILILMGSILKGRASIMAIAGILIIFNWPWPARQARSMALTIREREFINTILVAIGSEASLAVLGLSSTTTATLGNMIYWARQYQAILLKQWFWIGSPVIATIVLFIGLFLTYTGYNDYTSTKRGR